MILYDYYRSTACYRVRIALNIKNMSYEKLSVHLLNEGGEQHFPSYLNINPQGLVPTLDEHGHIISQSLAIVEYLEEISPKPALMPNTPYARAQVRSLALSIACDIHPLNNLRVLNHLREEFSADEKSIQSWYHHWLKSGFDALEIQLQRLSHKEPVCFGHEITMADICLIPQVYNALRFNFPLTNYARIQSIYDHCMGIAAFQEAAPE